MEKSRGMASAMGTISDKLLQEGGGKDLALSISCICQLTSQSHASKDQGVCAPPTKEGMWSPTRRDPQSDADAKVGMNKLGGYARIVAYHQEIQCLQMFACAIYDPFNVSRMPEPCYLCDGGHDVLVTMGRRIPCPCPLDLAVGPS